MNDYHYIRKDRVHAIFIGDGLCEQVSAGLTTHKMGRKIAVGIPLRSCLYDLTYYYVNSLSFARSSLFVSDFFYLIISFVSGACYIGHSALKWLIVIILNLFSCTMLSAFSHASREFWGSLLNSNGRIE